MLSIDIDIRKLVAPLSPHATPRAQPVTPAHRHDPDPGHDGATPPTARPGAPADHPPVTGKVYALKDGSGYVALANDGHYYKLDSAGAGLTFAPASGAIDASMVDVSGGPVRTLPRPPRAHAAAVHETHAHQPDKPDPDHARIAPDRRHVHGEHLGTTNTRAGHATTDPVLGTVTRSGAKDAAAVPGSGRPRSGRPDAIASADAARELIAGHPDAALRTHARVSRRAVAALLR